MFKLWVAIKKEFQLLLYDKAGLIVMFGMPLLLVYVITIVQDSAFRLVNENKISMVVVNQDQGKEGQKLVDLMQNSGLFDLQQNDTIVDLKEAMLTADFLTGMVISADFSDKLVQKASVVSSSMMTELGLEEEPAAPQGKLKLSALEFYHDPVLQENYCFSIINMIDAFLKTIEGELLILSLIHISEPRDRG